MQMTALSTPTQPWGGPADSTARVVGLLPPEPRTLVRDLARAAVEDALAGKASTLVEFAGILVDEFDAATVARARWDGAIDLWEAVRRMRGNGHAPDLNRPEALLMGEVDEVKAFLFRNRGAGMLRAVVALGLIDRVDLCGLKEQRARVDASTTRLAAGTSPRRIAGAINLQTDRLDENDLDGPAVHVMPNGKRIPTIT